MATGQMAICDVAAMVKVERVYLSGQFSGEVTNQLSSSDYPGYDLRSV